MLLPPPGFAAPGAWLPPFSLVMPVRWGDLDALGHVNHGAYLSLLEHVRWCWLRHVGLVAFRQSEGIGGVVARLEVDYRRSVGFPDELWVSCAAVAIGRSSMTLVQRAWSVAAGAVCCEAKVIAAVVDDRTAKAVPVPEPVRAAVRAWDGVAD